jgi:HAD superfamily hydrolase (TIGR01509 family)
VATGLVIFDCDGVLVDSERLAVQVEAALISELGWPLTEADVLERFVGRTDAYMRAEIERAIGTPLPGFQQSYEQRLHEAFRSELTVVEGVVDALDSLSHPMCVASSGTPDKMRLTLGLTGLLPRFEGRMFSATEVAAGKPAPDLFLYAARCCGVVPQDCVVVVDSLWGVEAARAAGMRSLGYSGGITPASWLEGPGTIVFDDMAALPALLAEPRT